MVTGGNRNSFTQQTLMRSYNVSSRQYKNNLCPHGTYSIVYEKGINKYLMQTNWKCPSIKISSLVQNEIKLSFPIVLSSLVANLKLQSFTESVLMVWNREYWTINFQTK